MQKTVISHFHSVYRSSPHFVLLYLHWKDVPLLHLDALDLIVSIVGLYDVEADSVEHYVPHLAADRDSDGDHDVVLDLVFALNVLNVNGSNVFAVEAVRSVYAQHRQQVNVLNALNAGNL